ncbi:MAG: NAD(P)/FAD-dependent oxidoreductase [Nitrospiraceae bacterium]|nr:MAG: NAD(P)/FAD-dependent oxidoreductase [Nitrospiraceae bacterium]
MNYLVIGNGVAGTTAAEQIRKIDGSGDIMILSDEKTPFYSRIRLIEYLAGQAQAEDIIIRKQDWYDRNLIRLSLNSPVREIEPDRKEVVLSGGEVLRYDRLLIATGGVSFVPPVPGSDKEGVFTLRTIQDADDIIRYGKERKKVILIGGGVLGLEAGNSLRKRGLDVTVVEFFPRLLPRQMDPEGAGILKAQMEGMGFSFFLGARTKEITGEGRARGIILEDGASIEGDMIIISAGVRPRASLAQKIGLTVNKGLVVNDRMETARRGIYAAGDLIEHRETFYGIWNAAEKQGEVAGINMAGGDALYEGTTMSNVLKVVGVDLAAAGDIDADGVHDSLVMKDPDRYIYKKFVIRDGILSGCILYGDISGYRRVIKAISEKRNVEGMRDALSRGDVSGV